MTATDPNDFEKYKLNVELFKWLITSVALVVMTTIIDWGFRDRTAGLQEVQQYDKYVTDLVVLNKDPGQKRMLAQFFSNVTPSEKLKKGWKEYYQEVNKEYQVAVAPVLKNDSAAKKRFYSLTDKKVLTEADKKELTKLDSQIKANQQIINPEIILPGKETSTNITNASLWESKGFEYLLQKDVTNAITAFANSESAYPSYHQVYEIGRYLTNNKNSLKSDNQAGWKAAYQTITTRFDYKLPFQVKANMKNAGQTSN